jgi:hypothetical protein
MPAHVLVRRGRAFKVLVMERENMTNDCHPAIVLCEDGDERFDLVLVLSTDMLGY